METKVVLVTGRVSGADQISVRRMAQPMVMMPLCANTDVEVLQQLVTRLYWRNESLRSLAKSLVRCVLPYSYHQRCRRYRAAT